jgi:branched-chain amino acid transport system substrate-binding protein
MLDSKGQVEEALAMFRRASDAGIPASCRATARQSPLPDRRRQRHNEREPAAMLFLNYSLMVPLRCPRRDAHGCAGRGDGASASIRRYLQTRITAVGGRGQCRAMLADRAPSVEIVGDELHPVGRVRDFAPYVAKIRASGADTVVTGNWGNDLTLLVRAAREARLAVNFYTFYANGLGAPTAIGEAGVGRVRAVAEWHPNAPPAAMESVYETFRQRFPEARDDYFQARTVVMVEMLARAIELAGGTDALAVARALSGMSHGPGHGNPLGPVTMRGADHQLIGPLVVSVMQRKGSPGVRFDVEGSGYGFLSETRVTPAQSERATSCRMVWPGR